MASAMGTHYEVLGIAEDATEAQIKAAYKAGALVHHPNKGGSNANFKRLGAAYDVLRNSEQRRDYDLALVASRVPSKKSKTSGSSKGASGAGGGHNNSRGGANAPKCSKDATLTAEQRELIQNLKDAVDLHSGWTTWQPWLRCDMTQSCVQDNTGNRDHRIIFYQRKMHTTHLEQHLPMMLQTYGCSHYSQTYT
jgi:curved DNA-binding protein CbpA